MSGHYLFEPEFCNVASGWEKGIVEKNVRDRRIPVNVTADSGNVTGIPANVTEGRCCAF